MQDRKYFTNGMNSVLFMFHEILHYLGSRSLGGTVRTLQAYLDTVLQCDDLMLIRTSTRQTQGMAILIYPSYMIHPTY